MTGGNGENPREVIRFSDRPTSRRSLSPASDDLFTEDDYGLVLLSSLIRAQLGATLSILIPAAALLSLYPLMAVLIPNLARAQVGGIPLTLVVLGGGIYPPLVVLGFWYVDKAERVERRFVNLLQEK
jgi:hypothetical protein